MAYAVLLTPPAVGAIAVIAVRGPGAGDAAQRLSGVLTNVGEAKRARFAHDGAAIDDGLVVGAGNDDIELHVHGGTAVVDAMLAALAAVGVERVSPDTLKPATLEDEVALALPRAMTETGVRLLAAQPVAMRAWVERVGRLDGTWRVDSEIQWVLDRSRSLMRLLTPARVAIVGRPNAGKSTLANALLGRPVAITSDVPGTTRDWVDAPAVLAHGDVAAPVVLVDTAGIRETVDPIEAEAIRRTHAQVRGADAAIVVVDAAAGDSEADIAATVPADMPFVIARNKIDLVRQATASARYPAPVIDVSARERTGLEALSAAVLEQLDLDDVRTDEVFAFTPRQVALLQAAATASGETTHARQRNTMMLLAAATLATGFLAGAASAEAPAERWVYVPTNMLVDANVEKVEALFTRSAKAGYTHVLLTDVKLHKLGDMDDRYVRNVERVKAAAANSKLEIVPGVFPIGYSGAILWHDPNLAEALPVRGVPLVVKAGVATPERDPAAALKGGDFSNLKLWSWHDPTVTYDAAAKAAKITDPTGRNCRIVQKLKLTPFRQYHVSLRAKTTDFKATLEVKVLTKTGSLTHSSLGVKATQDWTTHHVVFNSLDNTEANLYIGCWGGGTGAAWVADARLEEAPFVNMVRREGAPLAIRTADGRALVEGKDFEPFADPLMGSKPWPGSYDVYHAPPVLKTRLPDGTRLLASYYHVITVHDGQVAICPSEKKTVALLRDEAKRIHALFKAKRYFMSHDEIRVWNWCDACQQRKMTAGELLADNARTCVKILKETAPGAKVYVWSDMFDPHHNARDNYYLVRGDYRGSWEGLDKDVILVLWYQSKAKDSMGFFGERGHRMLIAGYYDGPVASVNKWLDAAGTAGKGKVEGVMYTTWRNDYTQLEAFAKELGK